MTSRMRHLRVFGRRRSGPRERHARLSTTTAGGRRPWIRSDARYGMQRGRDSTERGKRGFAQQASQGGAAMSFYEKGPVRIYYEETGSGFPLLLIAGGGLNSTISGLKRGDPFDPLEEFKREYRCIA